MWCVCVAGGGGCIKIHNIKTDSKRLACSEDLDNPDAVTADVSGSAEGGWEGELLSGSERTMFSCNSEI
jgi:hypothetical protein